MANIIPLPTKEKTVQEVWYDIVKKLNDDEMTVIYGLIGAALKVKGEKYD